MDLFYAPSEHISSDLLTLTADEYHHAVHVLRKKVGDLLYCIDGKGHCYTTRITAVTKTSLTAKILLLAAKVVLRLKKWRQHIRLGLLRYLWVRPSCVSIPLGYLSLPWFVPKSYGSLLPDFSVYNK
jgi:hypothetical protein